MGFCVGSLKGRGAHGVRLRRMDWIRDTICCVVTLMHSGQQIAAQPSSEPLERPTFPLGEGIGGIDKQNTLLVLHNVAQSLPRGSNCPGDSLIR